MTLVNADRGDRTVIIAPDSFKGSLAAATVAKALAQGLSESGADLLPLCRGLSDGGEGLLDCLSAAGGTKRRYARVTAVHGVDRDAPWLTMSDGAAAIESAQALGMSLIRPNGPDLAQRGSGGVGQLVRAALDAGCHRIVVGLGGSATNDAGLGFLAALGVQARDAHNRPVTPDLAGLSRVAALDWRGLDPRLEDSDLIALCDVDNPLTGTHGCTRIYGPQKGLCPDRAAAVDAAVARFTRLAAHDSARFAERPGAGAAGGLGFALALLGARLAPGADETMRLLDLDTTLAGATAVITGEGRADSQTLRGKLPTAVAEHAWAQGRPIHLVAGNIDPDARPALTDRFAGLLSLTELAGDEHEAMRNTTHWLRQAGHALAASIQAI